MEERKRLSIRMDAELHDKLKYIAEYDGRSMSRQILHLITTCVRTFEQEHGPIQTEDPS